ncbi:glycosyltransferase, partial [Escherichia coli]
DYELKNKSDEDYKKTITDDTKLIHYVGVTKPWNDWTNYPCQKYFNEAYQASCWNDVAFIPATNEKQYQVKSRHLKRNGNIASSFYYFMLYYSKKIARKHFSK